MAQNCPASWLCTLELTELGSTVALSELSYGAARSEGCHLCSPKENVNLKLEETSK